LPTTGDHLDVGSGTGELLRLVRAHYPFRSFGCDYTDKLLCVPGAEIQTVDLNREPLPYNGNRFALVTCIETVEHLENYREVVREIYRVLQPGGVAVFSTPNILNLRSRLRYLSSGFYNLFGPLAPDESAIHTTRGHINPVSWFYLSHALLSAALFWHFRSSSFLCTPPTGLFITVIKMPTAPWMSGMPGLFER
jgi:2-polyprenyl-3-methyl-5-hydroxy-6-metoxy-1,4-benzoquinol methylase